MTLYRITPTRFEPRAAAPPPHDGPDPASMAVLDGPTARLRSLDHQRAAREALQQRPGSSVYGPADQDDEHVLPLDAEPLTQRRRREDQ